MDNIPKGYKKTEIGVIPEDWEICSLNDCLTLLTDFEANGSFESVATNVSVYNSVNFAWYVRATDLENAAELSEVKYVDKESYKFLSKTELLGNEVLVTKRGEIGKVYFFIKKTKFATLGPNMYLLKLNNKATPRFIYYFFKSDEGYKSLLSNSASTTLGALYKNDIKAIQLPLPSKDEQNIISTTLLDMDLYITSLEKLIEKKKMIKQGVMQELLTGKRRLAGFTGKWKENLLGNIVEIKKGSLITSGTLRKGLVPVVAGGKQPAYFHNEANRSANTITISASGANAGYVNFYETPIFASDCSTISESDKYDVQFVYHWLKLKQFEIYKRQTGGAQPHIHPSDLNPMKVLFPEIEEQIVIAEVISNLNYEIKLLESKLSKLKQIKQGAMQQLLTGKIRLINK